MSRQNLGPLTTRPADLLVRSEVEMPPEASSHFWEVFGHSYFIYPSTLNQTGRMDSLVRVSLGIDANNWRNRAVSGARLMQEGRQQGGYTRPFQEILKSNRTAPYAMNGGAFLFCWGINDIGNLGVTTQWQSAFTHTYRAVISRARASSIRENTDASVTYSGFTLASNTQGFTSGSSMHQSSTVGHTVTITIPTDYTGEPIYICLSGQSGAFGGTVTFSGTAGVTGTLSNSNITPTGSFTHAPVGRRITNLTAANAGQTIVMTVSQVDASGAVAFDAWWIEARNPNPVVVCNIPRLPVAGYRSYGSMAAISQAGGDANVALFNTLITNVVAEFDSMCVIANLDAAIGFGVTLPAGITNVFSVDSVHPNEYGCALAANAIVEAIRKLKPNAGLGRVGQLGGPSPIGAAVRIPRLGTSTTQVTGTYVYTPDYGSVLATGTTLNAAGTMWAMPVSISEATERWIRLQLEVTTASVGTTNQNLIRWGLYDDVGPVGYPQNLITELTGAGALSLGTTTGIKQSPASGTGSLNQPLEPGTLVWIVLKSETLAVGGTPVQAVLRSITGPNRHLPSWGAGAANAVSSTAGANGAQAWILTGQATGALPTTFPSGAAVSNSAPLVGFQTF